MALQGKKLGVLLAAPPGAANFNHALELASAARAQGVQVYLYCLDKAIEGLDDPTLQNLKGSGVKLFACAFGAQRRQIRMRDQAVFGGLGGLSDVISLPDRFVAFT